MWRRASGIAILVIALKLADRQPAPVTPNTKVIYVGPGCGHVAYTLGFVGGLLDDEKLRQAIQAHGAVFGGASSGAFAAAYAMASLNGVRDMAWWYQNGMRPGYQEIKRTGSTLCMGRMLDLMSRDYYRICRAALGIGDASGLPWLRWLPISATDVGTLRPRFLTSFASEDEFADSIVASSYVPGLMGLQPWHVINGSRVFDGYAGLWTTTFPDSYLFLSFLPTLPITTLGRNYILAYTLDSTNESLATKAWPWGDPAWADGAFQRGRADATAQQLRLRATILAFLDQAT